MVVLFLAFNDAYAARHLFPQARIGDLDWVDPGYKPMQDYLIRIAEELVRHYSIDGISLDTLRYPAGVASSSLPYTGSRSRIDVITQFAARFAESVHRIAPTVSVSAHIFADTCYSPNKELGQDLVRLEHVLDFVHPMLYPYDDSIPGHESEHYAYVYKALQAARAQGAHLARVVPDVQAFFGYRTADLLAEVKAARDAGAGGAVVYAYDFDIGWKAEDFAPLASLAPADSVTVLRRDAAEPFGGERGDDRPEGARPTATRSDRPGLQVAFPLITDGLTVLRVSTPFPTRVTLSYTLSGHASPSDGKVIWRPEPTTTQLFYLGPLRQGAEYRYDVKAVAPNGECLSSSGTFTVPANLALHATALASSVIHPGFGPEMVLDGSLATRWCSRYTDYNTLTLDLGKPARIGSVGLEWEYAYARAYSLEVSLDGHRWKRVFSTQTGNGGREDIPLEPVTARYLRITMTQRATALGYSLWEVAVYAPRPHP